MNDKKDFGTVELPESIISRVEQRLPYTNWETPSEYIAYVLDETLTQVEAEVETPNTGGIDEDEVENRLKALGYLNE